MQKPGRMVVACHYTWALSANSVASALALRGEEEGVCHLFLLLSQAVPHGGHNLGDVSEGGVGILSLDGGLRVPEEERVGWDGFLRFVGVLLLLLLLRLGLLDHLWWRPLLPGNLVVREEGGGMSPESAQVCGVCHLQKQHVGAGLYHNLPWTLMQVNQMRVSSLTPFGDFRIHQNLLAKHCLKNIVKKRQQLQKNMLNLGQNLGRMFIESKADSVTWKWRPCAPLDKAGRVSIRMTNNKCDCSTLIIH